ncbi:hypothetical protein JN11_02808 [Mucilaginibacter frigoritolerans]|uniref:Immunity protein 26 of polymorphic toxin system n=1 Tax=Mucilaginibacter frigoritolerans TaxID=652788 RepID=A0A562U0N8_9SPHI|nr:hypothetical protein [Mucilaginibacter frigoritolerans]TWI98620.1 hypothetical protein JN11_02808 [Mucilaginibacter frigoritolerans]
MKRVSTKIGDVFSVKVDTDNVKCFQLIAFDLYQLNSDVIRVFDEVYPIGSIPDLSVIVKSEVAFYAHCVTKFGTKMGLWEKVGNTTDIGETSHIIFRGTSDYGTKRGEEPIKISRNWYVWRLGDLQTVRVGDLEGVNRKAEIGLVMTPYDIVDRIKTGNYHGFYPGFL